MAATAPPSALLNAGLRTTLVSRLTGLAEDRLRYWHESTLQVASTRAGSRGVPRLYNWLDYMRLRVIASLVGEGVPTRTIRRAVLLLDEVLPDWYLLPARTEAARCHVLVHMEGAPTALVADQQGQLVMRWPAELGEAAAATGRALTDLTGPGADLGLLHDFGDAVRMVPEVNLAKPTLVGTSLETRFVRAMSEDLGGPERFAPLYRLDAALVRRAIQFEEAVA